MRSCLTLRRLRWRHRLFDGVKIYGADSEGAKRYSPAKCLGCVTLPVVGDPDPKHISTSYVERSNLTMRMHTRRFTRLTNRVWEMAEIVELIDAAQQSN